MSPGVFEGLLDAFIVTQLTLGVTQSLQESFWSSGSLLLVHRSLLEFMGVFQTVLKTLKVSGSLSEILIVSQGSLGVPQSL